MFSLSDNISQQIYVRARAFSARCIGVGVGVTALNGIVHFRPNRNMSMMLSATRSALVAMASWCCDRQRSLKTMRYCYNAALTSNAAHRARGAAMLRKDHERILKIEEWAHVRDGCKEVRDSIVASRGLGVLACAHRAPKAPAI
jgi:hypothetical protein